MREWGRGVGDWREIKDVSMIDVIVVSALVLNAVAGCIGRFVGTEFGS